MRDDVAIRVSMFSFFFSFSLSLSVVSTHSTLPLKTAYG